jgi:site-specific DNA recombinase
MAQIDKRIGNIVDAVAKGFAQASMAARLTELEAEKAHLEVRLTTLRGAVGGQRITEDDLRGLFGLFRQYVREKNVPEIRRFIGHYIEKVIVYKDHVEVVFFFCPGAERAEGVRMTVTASRRKIVGMRAA